MENKQCGPFDEPDSHRTLAIEVEDRKFYVPRDLMAAYSPAFKSMLYGEFAEAKKDAIQLREKKAEDIEELLGCLVPTPRQKPIDTGNVELILSLSDEYQIEEFKYRAEVFLKDNVINCRKADPWLLEILRLGSKYRMKDVLVKCTRRCAMEFGLGRLERMFKDLPSEVVASLMIFVHTPSESVPIDESQCMQDLRYEHIYCATHKHSGPCTPEKETYVREMLNRMS